MVGLIAALQSTAGAFLMSSGSIITRDLYIRLVKDSCGGKYGFFSAHASNSFTLAVFFGLLYKKKFRYLIYISLFYASLISYSRIYLGVHFPLDIIFGATFGIIIGILIVILTETIGQQITGNRLPWGRWPLTIHSGVWGLLFNIFVCFSISAFSSVSKNDIYRSHREKFHDFMNDHMGLHPSRSKLRSFAYVIVLIWLFFGIGPGQILGNLFFGEPGAGFETWVLKIPSIWGYQLIWWVIGIGLIWFLASKMDLSTLPNKPIQPNDLFKGPNETEADENYIDKVGTGYGWILILAGLAILIIIFYAYVV